jgi:predicted TIM-barrel fold metal-dependent hydrolase
MSSGRDRAKELHIVGQFIGADEELRALIDLVYRFLPDETARRAVLVDNPARLHGFE